MRSATVLSVVAPVALLGLVSIAGADCGADHKASAGGSTAGVAGKSGATSDKTTVVVTGAPGQSIEVKAPAGYSVSATGGAGSPGQAGAAGAAGAAGQPSQ